MLSGDSAAPSQQNNSKLVNRKPSVQKQGYSAMSKQKKGSQNQVNGGTKGQKNRKSTLKITENDR